MIEINNLAFSYGRKCVLEHISMTLEEGKIYGLLGENGVGKTTLLTLLCGLKKVGEGSIRTDGADPYRRQPAFLSRQFYLPDELPSTNARPMAWAKEYGRFWPDFSLDEFGEILAELDVPDNLRMNNMSAGQLKKTYISLALAVRAKYLFMDEPTNGLDIPSKSQFRSAILKHTREDSTIVISTHQVRDLENIIDPIIILDRQEVLLNAPVYEILEKLYFDYGTILRPDTLYCEQLPGGFIQVCPNPEARDSKINIEALFNAVLSHKAEIKAMFTPKNQ